MIFGYEKFTEKQINRLIQLCLKLRKNIKLKKIFLGHSDIAPKRKKILVKKKFPWKKLKKK